MASWSLQTAYFPKTQQLGKKVSRGPSAGRYRSTLWLSVLLKSQPDKVTEKKALLYWLVASWGLQFTAIQAIFQLLSHFMLYNWGIWFLIYYSTKRRGHLEDQDEDGNRLLHLITGKWLWECEPDWAAQNQFQWWNLLKSSNEIITTVYM